MADARKRNFAFVMYPESAPDNWYQIISELKVPCFISPLHDKDVNPSGEPKKSHYHIMLMFEGNKSQEQIDSMLKDLNLAANGYYETVASLRGYARYLCHLDNPEKYLYSINDVISLCGSDYQDVIGRHKDDREVLISIMNYIEEKNIFSFRVLTNLVVAEHKEWFDVLAYKNTLFLKEYLKSRSWDFKKPVD